LEKLKEQVKQKYLAEHAPKQDDDISLLLPSIPQDTPSINTSKTEASQDPLFLYSDNNQAIEFPQIPRTQITTSQIPPAQLQQKKKIIVSGELFQQFMQRAENNTSKGIETCGVLGGKMDNNNTYFITTLILPSQTGTKDTSQTTNEDQLVEYQIKHDLLTLGWIHTHPTQDCFLSSVDQHTQLSYQLMMTEAIAVVIAPKFSPNFGIFALTPNGITVLQKCDLKGFHPHEKGLYQLAEHIELVWGMQFSVMDFRY